MPLKTPVTPCLWLSGTAEAAARFYTSVFPDSAVTGVNRTQTDLPGGQPAGDVLAVEFHLSGTPFLALNGGPFFQINEAVSFMVACETQEEIDYYWNQLTEGGPVESQVCGWLKDRYGVTWQVYPVMLPALITNADPAVARRVVDAMHTMGRLIIADLEKAAKG